MEARSLTHRRHRRPPALAAVTVGGVLVVVGAFLPWLRSGSRQRSSFELFAVIERLEFSPDGVGGSIIRWWPVMPVVLLAGLAMAWWHLPRLGLVLVVIGGLHAAALVVAMAVAPVASGIGVLVTFVGIVLLLPASIVVAWPSRG